MLASMDRRVLPLVKLFALGDCRGEYECLILATDSLSLCD